MLGKGRPIQRESGTWRKGGEDIADFYYRKLTGEVYKTRSCSGRQKVQEYEGGMCVSGPDAQGAKMAESTDDFRNSTAAFTSPSMAEPAWL